MSLIDLTTPANVKAWQSPPLTTTGDDAVITRLITAASRFILNELQRPILSSQLYTEQRDGEGGVAMVLRQWPVTSIAALTIDGIATAPAAAGGRLPGWVLESWDGWSAGQPQKLSLIGGRFTRGVQNVVVSYAAGYLVAAEPQLVPASPGPYTVTPDFFWVGDGGVRYAGGDALTAVAADPGAGQYVPPATQGGVYQFDSADAGAAVVLSYSYIPDDLQQACIALVSLRLSERARIGQVSKSLAGEVVAFTQKDMPADVATTLQSYRRVIAP